MEVTPIQPWPADDGQNSANAASLVQRTGVAMRNPAAPVVPARDCRLMPRCDT